MEHSHISNNQEQIPLFRRSRKAKIAVAACGFLISHVTVFFLGVEYMRYTALSRLDSLDQQMQQTIEGALPKAPESERSENSTEWSQQNLTEDDVSNSRSNLAHSNLKQPDDADAGFCWEGEPCESSTHPGVYYVHLTRDGGGPAVWPLPDPDGCESNRELICTDPASGFDYAVWKGVYTWYSSEAEELGLEPYGTQSMGDSSALAQ